ncbi:transposase [Pontiellaceae bacterium B12227]|nr:transposase [Pontiellaceae bacterium B12227]
MKDRKHLRRLSVVYESHPRYFISVCIDQRRQLLTRSDVHEILRKHWAKSLPLYGWAIGSYAVMPDHVHFFCADAESRTTLSSMVGSWKQWSSKEICALLGIKAPIWQREFFDHLIRSDASYSNKWEYVRQNPVVAGLVEDAEAWEFSGYIDYV